MKTSHTNAVKMVTEAAAVVGTERIALADSFGRVLAQEVHAADNVPPFDRSPLDGYAFRACDTTNASTENPVTLKVIEDIPAGAVSHFPVTEGTAVRLMTGAPIPEGADAVSMYELTEFTDTEVKIFRPVKHGENVIYAGEDVKKGTPLAEPGMKIDAGLMGTLALQNIEFPEVYRQLKVGIISTGNELANVGEKLAPGKVYDSNQFSISGALTRLGFVPVRYGIVFDTVDAISTAIEKALKECDAVITTGGVSVGDYDFTPDAMEKAGIEILFRGVDLKPGMACAYGAKNGKLVCGLTGNPASSLTNFYVIGMPGLRKMSGLADYKNKELPLVMANDFNKDIKRTRVLRGMLDLTDGTAKIIVPEGQGNVVLNSSIGSDCVAIVPAGSGPLTAGTIVKGFLV
ncbi:MAG: gephyrin-like molybdotransferase Glp [Lachnospiraceae bacterium]|jgi:molybdopterin molybdotransferase